MDKKLPKKSLDDVALKSPGLGLELTLSDVGLENVQTQVLINGSLLPARAHAGVSLIDKTARGIHMSRIFRAVVELDRQELTWSFLNETLAQILKSHQDLSDAGYLHVSFDLPVKRKGLLSESEGWRLYPVTFKVDSIKGIQQCKLSVKVLYSSTCPCSAGLSRQAIQEQFLKDFADNSSLSLEQVATWLGKSESVAAAPHAQRSEAIVEFTLNPDSQTPTPLMLIDVTEKALGTPVQASVKREDEQEFARLNAQNLMFCEDAARKLKSAFLRRQDITDFAIEVRHFESLHPHDVVARVRKSD